MDFSLSRQTRSQMEAVRRFVQQELQPLEEEVETKGVLEPDKARDIFERSHKSGFYAMNIPKEFGGAGLSAVEMSQLEQEMGQTTDILIRRAFGNVYEVLLACNKAQCDEWLLPAVRGE